MSLTTPTTKAIADNIIAQLESTLNQTIPLLPKAFNRVLAKALAAIYVILYKYGGFIFLQIFVSTASAQETDINGKTVIPIVEWGRLIGVGDPVPAVNAEILVDVTVENQVGSLPVGSQLINSTNGVTYITTADVLLNAPVIQVTVRASRDQAGGDGGGAIGNLDPGEIITFANPLANVASDTVVVSTSVTGADGEDINTTYRQRVIDRFKKRPQGGAYADYEIWGERTPGVIRIYPYTGAPGEVDVFSEVSTDIDPDGIPPPATLLAVFENIELDENGRATQRNANAFVNSLPITRTGFDVDVVDLLSSDLPQLKLDIIAALVEFFLGREPFIDGLSILPKTNTITATSVISIVENIVALDGGSFTAATFKLNSGGGNLTSFTLGNGEKAKSVLVTFS